MKLLLTILLQILCLNIYAQGESTPVEIYWSCPSRVGPNGVRPNFPESKIIVVSYKASGELDTSRLKELLTTLAAPNYSISSCLYQLSNTVQNIVELACMQAQAMKNNKSAKEYCSNTNIPQAVWPIQGQITALARKLDAKELPPKEIIGLDPLYVPPNYQHELIKMTKMSVEQCQIMGQSYSHMSEAGTVDLGHYGDYPFYEELKNQIAPASPECRKKLLVDIVSRLVPQMSRSCGMGKYPICENVRKANARVFKLLPEIFPGEFKASKTDTQKYYKNICESDQAVVQSELLVLLTGLKNINQCVSLNPGQSKIVEEEIPIPAKYRLSRPSKDVYKAELRINFEPKERNKKFQEKVAECYEDKASYLKGPDKKRLVMSISNDPAVPAININLKPKDFRSNSKNWEEDISCETMIHESLHLLGLVDEYKEEWIGYVTNVETGKLDFKEKLAPKDLNQPNVEVFKYGTCRAIGPQNSVMSHQEKAFDDAHRFLGANHSVLYPAHFNAITLPGCNQVNEKYYVCASSAYETPIGKQCTAKPNYCYNWKEWLGQKD